MFNEFDKAYLDFATAMLRNDCKQIDIIANFTIEDKATAVDVIDDVCISLQKRIDLLRVIQRNVVAQT